MDYKKVYANLIDNRKTLNRKKGDGIYYEKHHILPRCLGGNNSKENLVLLTAKEHFISHLLLTKCYEGKEKIKMVWALRRMSLINKNHSQPPNNTTIFDSFTNISTPLKSKKEKEMETNTAGYLYWQELDKDSQFDFDFVNNPFLSTLAKIENLLSLNDNWDGYKAVPVFAKAGKNAYDFVNSLDANTVEKITDIFPNTHGTITFEWEKEEDRKMVLEIGSNSYSYFVSDYNKPPILVDGKNILLDYRKITTQINDVIRENSA